MPTKVEPLQQIVQSAFADVTPVRLRLLFVANIAGAILFFLVSMGTVIQHENAVKTVGVDAAPSVIAAHEIKIGVERMDADLANELLNTAGQPDGVLMVDDFEKWRTEVGKQLVAAAKNITYGTAEQVPIENLQVGIGKFEMQVQAARDLHAAGSDKVVSEGYSAALNTVQDTLLPNADALNKANSDALEATYSEEKSESALSRGLVLAAGIVLIALLVYTQFYLRTHFRRRINPPLLIASVCVILFVHHLTGALARNSRDLKVAKEDAYNSIVSLLDARAHAYEASAAESRGLLDREHAAEHEKRFADEVATVASFAPGHDVAQAVERAKHQMEDGEKITLPGFTGSLAEELNNIRFDGEGQSAVEALEAFGDYLTVDAKLRQLIRGGDRSECVKLCLSYAPNGSKFPFTRFDDALGMTLRINQDHFERAVALAFKDLGGLADLCVAVSLLIAVCSYIGLRPRMAEYA